ncbi:MAG: fibronectin type III domain-containing protein, partial [Candidatus Oxydemutatoraceae bacterium WSBS_2016_MAG_OTU14]
SIRINAQRFPSQTSSFVITELVPGRVHELSARAYSDDARYIDSEALEISFRTLEVLPIPREDQIRWAADETTLTVSWDDVPEGVTSYDLTLTRTDGATDIVVGGPIEVDARTAGSTTFSELTAGMTYTLSVVAKGDASSYVPSPEYRVTVTTNAPGQLSAPIVTLSIANNSSRNIVVLWNEVMNATSYTVNLYLGNDRATPISTPITVMSETHTFDGPSLDLKFGTEYTIGVIAHAQSGEPLQSFLSSNERFRSIKTDSFILSAPMGISLSATTNSVIVSWSTVEPALNIESYLLSISPDTADVGEQTIAVSESGYTFTGLSEGDEYELSVVSSRDETGYIQSSAYRATIRALPQLDAPTGLATSAITGNSISFAWSLVAEATTFNVSLYSGGDTNTMALQTLTISQSGENNLASFDMLEPVIEYTIEVIAQAENHRDSVPAMITITTAKQQLEAPREEQIRWTAGDETTLRVDWIDVPEGVSSYVLTLTRTEGLTDTVVGGPKEVDARAAGSTTFGELTARTTYTLSVVAKGDASLYIPSPQYSTVVTLERLINTTVMLSIESSVDIVVLWDEVTNAESYKVSLYSSAGVRVNAPITVMDE